MAGHTPEFRPSVIRQGRLTKEKARADGKLLLGGKRSDSYKEVIAPAVEARITEALDTHREWIDRELGAFTSSKGGISSLDAVKAFKGAFETRIRQYARLNKAPEALVQGQIFDTLFEQTAFDFIQSLRMSRHRGDTPKDALQLASQSHWLNPDTLDKLNAKYEGQVDPSVIKTAALKRPKQPEQFIKEYVKRLARLKVKYEDRVDPMVIKHVAKYNSSEPDEFIDSYLKTVNTFSRQYGEIVEENVIKTAALRHPKHAEEFINSYQKLVERLSGEYGNDIDKEDIKFIALRHYKRPDTFIKDYLATVDRLGLLYKDRADKSLIKKAALLYYKNPEAFIDWFLGAEKTLFSQTVQSKRSVVHKTLYANPFKSDEELKKLI